jgi:acetyl-CoA carboxylase carboxyl transferase subunit beta
LSIFNRNKYSPPRPIYLENKHVPIPEVPRDIPEKHVPHIAESKMWIFCPNCGAHIFWEEQESSMQVCKKCGYNFRLGAKDRIEMTVDEGSFEEFNAGMIGNNPLDFPDYDKKQQSLREKLGENEAIVTGVCTIEGISCVLAVMDSRFMMGSMGVALGEKFTLAAEKAIAEKLPFVVFTASGGARMQEGLFSLMQMAKTSAVCAKMDESGIFYLTVITDPTTGGVTASFASLGDVILAEPGALLGFAGKRVIQQTTGETLPKGFQTAEFMLSSGFIDRIVKRKDLRGEIAKLLRMHGGKAK